MKRGLSTKLMIGIGMIASAFVTAGAITSQGSVKAYVPVETVLEDKTVLGETESDELSWAEIESIHNNLLMATEVVTEEETTEEETTETETEVETAPIYEWTPYSFICLDASTQTEIKSVCDSYEIAYDLIIAICMQESSLDPNCIGDNGKAFGLGQIREEYWGETAAELGLSNWKTDPVENSEMVCYIMSRQMNEFGMTMDDALNIYRHGVTYDITEPDGLTYVSHIKNNLAYIEEMKGTEK